MISQENHKEILIRVISFKFSVVKVIKIVTGCIWKGCYQYFFQGYTLKITKEKSIEKYFPIKLLLEM